MVEYIRMTSAIYREGGYQAHNGPLSIKPIQSVDLDAAIQDRIAVLAAKVRSAEPMIDKIAAFGPGVHKGCGAGPGFWFGDTAEIHFLAQTPGKRFDYRLGWLAGSECVVVIGGPTCASFEDYQRRILKVPGLRYLNVDPDEAQPRSATPVRCLRDPRSYQLVLSEMTHRQNATLYAHQTTGTIWALAARLNRDTGKPVHVAGPPPLLSRRTNDKIWFGDIARRLLGADAVSTKRTAQSWSILTWHVAELARKRERLVIKVPDSAGSEGNFVVQSRDVVHLSLPDLYAKLRDLLPNHGKGLGFPVLVEVWDVNVLTSPSVQMWIPLPEHGSPEIEGLFEQVLSGEDAAFAGAIQAKLPTRFDQALCHGAMQLATLFQQLGYFGRCSFDTLITGTSYQDAKIHWIECNARWGGVSIPMSLVNRLAGPGSTPQYSIVQNDTDRFPPMKFIDMVAEFADLTDTQDLQTGVIFLTPNLTETGTGVHFLSLGGDAGSATDQARQVLRRFRRTGRQDNPA